MGKKTHTDTHHRHRHHHKYSHTLPSSPTHSSSSSDFEFTISAVSPRKSTGGLCPADELFYKGQLLPLHLSPRISMVRNLLLASSSTSSSSDTTTTASRDSTGSSSSSADCDSSRPSSVAEEDEFKRIHSGFQLFSGGGGVAAHHQCSSLKKSKYFSRLSRFSSVFRKELPSKPPPPPPTSTAASPSSSVKRMSATAREVIRKYMKKVKPLYEKLSQKQQQQQQQKKDPANDAVAIKHSGQTYTTSFLLPDHRGKGSESSSINVGGVGSSSISHSFSGNLRYPRKGRSYVSSCPSSMRSSPSHSGILYSNRPSGSGTVTPPSGGGGGLRSHGSYDASSMEELQSAIQGAIAHCKNSMNKSIISNEIQGGLI